MSEIRSQIVEVVAKLPANLTYTDFLLKEFEDSRELHQHSADLYIAILQALEGIVGWCRKHAAGQ